MAGPWEDFAQPAAEAGPWADFASQKAPETVQKASNKAGGYGTAANVAGGVVEPLLALGSGMLAKPAGDVVGLAGLGLEGLRRMGLPIDERDPLQMQRDVQQGMTYQPRTQVGQAALSPLATLGEWLSSGAKAAENYVAPPQTSGPLQAAVGYGVHELVNQLPMALGFAPSMAAPVMSGARGLMRSSLGGSRATPAARADLERAVQTMMDEGHVASRGDMTSLQDISAGLGNEVESRLQGLPPGVSVNAVNALTRAASTINDFRYSRQYPTDIASIRNAMLDWMSSPEINAAGEIPIMSAQRMKQMGYRQAGPKAYGRGVFNEAEDSTFINANRGLREEIENIVPSVGPLNQRQGDIINALKFLEPRLYRNGDPISFGWMFHNPMNALAYAGVKSDYVKSLLAQTLAQAAEGAPITRRLLGTAITGEANDQK